MRLEYALSKTRKHLYVSVRQVMCNNLYACSEGAFPPFFSCSISCFAVVKSSSDGTFTSIRYITFCSANGQPSHLTHKTSLFLLTHLPHHLLYRPLPSDVTNRAPNRTKPPHSPPSCLALILENSDQSLHQAPNTLRDPRLPIYSPVDFMGCVSGYGFALVNQLPGFMLTGDLDHPQSLGLEIRMLVVLYCHYHCLGQTSQAT